MSIELRVIDLSKNWRQKLNMSMTIDQKKFENVLLDCFGDDAEAVAYMKARLDHGKAASGIMQAQGLSRSWGGVSTKFRCYCRKRNLRFTDFAKIEQDSIDLHWRRKRQLDNPVGLYMSQRVPVTIHR